VETENQGEEEMNILKLLFARKIVVVSRAPLDEKLRRHGFVCEDVHPLWRSVMDVIDASIEDAGEAVSNPALTANTTAMAHAAGAFEGLKKLRAELIAQRLQAVKPSKKDA